MATTRTNKSAGGLTLITGATGFLGSHLVRELVGRGLGPLRVMQSGPPPAWLTDPALGVEVLRGSVLSQDDVARAMAGVTRVYHLAGMVSHKPDESHRMYQVHVEGTRTVCAAAVAAGVKRVVLSSTSGTIAVSKRDDAGLDESSPAPMDLISRWPYYASKLYQEEAAKRACGDKVELVMVNPSLLLGPGDDRLSSTRVILQFLGRELTLIPKGGLNFVDARDVAAVMPVAMERGTPGARYLLGAANWTFKDFFDRLDRMAKVGGPRLTMGGKFPLWATRAQAAIFRKWGKSVPVEPVSVDIAMHYWYFDSTLAARELGFEARNPTDTLFDTVRYIRENFLGTGGSDALVKRAG